MAATGTLIVSLTTWSIDNYVLFWSGIPVLIIGFIGVIVFGGKTKRYLWNLLDFF